MLGKPADYLAAIRSCDDYLARGGKQGAEVFSVRGQAHMKLVKLGTGHQVAAVGDFTEALSKDPEDWSLYQQRGYAYLAGAAYTFAESDFSAAIRLKPENPEAYLGRGYARVKLGRSEEAVADAEEAIRRSKEKNTDLLHRAARIYAQAIGNFDTSVGQHDRSVVGTRARYQDRAVDLIRQALDSLPRQEQATFWWESIASDPALRPIRQSTRYEHLAERYPRPLPKKDQPG
jgi:tetratricopeptide (TPR) repeat protein